MRRRFFPAAVSWLLRLGSCGLWTEELEGDLLEQYRGGRSAGWLARQVLAVVGMGVVEWLRASELPLIFSIGWAALYPEWLRLELSGPVHRVLLVWTSRAWPLYTSTRLVMGMVPILLFLWLGLLVFVAMRGRAMRGLSPLRMLGSVSLGLSVLLVGWLGHLVTGGSGLIAPSPGRVFGSTHPVGAAALLALSVFLSTATVYRSGRARRRLLRESMLYGGAASMADAALWRSRLQGEGVVAAAVAARARAKERMWPGVVFGFGGAAFASAFFCVGQRTEALRWPERIGVALLYLLLAAGAGAAGVWLATLDAPRQRRRNLMLAGAGCWMFLPAVVLLVEQRVLLAPLLAAMAMVLLAVSVSRLRAPELRARVVQPVFTTEIDHGPASWRPFVLSAALFGAGTAVAAGWLVSGTLLLAACVFAVALTAATGLRGARQARRRLRAGRGLSIELALAFCCVLVGLSGSVNSSLEAEMRALSLWIGGGARRGSPLVSIRPHKTTGYEAIVLWPLEKKDSQRPHLPRGMNFFGTDAMGGSWVIPFDGPYWYLRGWQPAPGRDAFRVHGDPLRSEIVSTDGTAMRMEARQRLPEAIPLSCCKEMRLVLRNDSQMGASAVAVSLLDSHEPLETTELGTKRLGAETVVQVAAAKATPQEQTVSFALPKTARLRAFDQIRVVFEAQGRRRLSGRKVAVERFVMVPR